METILIVDDEKNYLLVLEALLTETGYEVITTENADKGLEIAASHDLDLFLIGQLALDKLQEGT